MQQQQRRRALTGSRSSGAARHSRPDLGQHHYYTTGYPYNRTTWDGQAAMRSSVVPARSAASRPVSWHPSSTGLAGQQRPLSMYEMQYRNQQQKQQQLPLYHHQTVNMNGLPTPMTHPDLDLDAVQAPYLNLDLTSNSTPCGPPPPLKHASSDYYIPTTTESFSPYQPKYLHHQQSLQPTYDTGMSTPSTTIGEGSNYLYPTLASFPAYATYYSAAPASTRAWAQTLPEVPVYTAPSSPCLLPAASKSDGNGDGSNTQQNGQNEIGSPARSSWLSAAMETTVKAGDGSKMDNVLTKKEHDRAPLLPRKDSKPDLVGMGLYDTPDDSFGSSDYDLGRLSRLVFPDSASAVDSTPEEDAASGAVSAATTRRGLKLEETWEPPEEEDEDDDEEDYDEDEDDEMGEAEEEKQEAQTKQGTIKEEPGRCSMDGGQEGKRNTTAQEAQPAVTEAKSAYMPWDSGMPHIAAAIPTHFYQPQHLAGSIPMVENLAQGNFF